MKIAFLGSAEFGLPALKRLMQAHEIVAMVTTPAKPKGRGLLLAPSAIGQFAAQAGLKPVFSPFDLKDPEFQIALAACGADLFVVVAFRILPKSLFSLPRFGTVNIHASLLPRFRGPAPIQRAIEAGETETGITIFKIDEGIDTGVILKQKRTPIGPTETTPELYGRLSVMGADALMEALDELGRGATAPIEQDHTAASKAPKLTKEEALIRWDQPANTIFNKIRAFKPFPGTYALLREKRLGIIRAEPAEADQGLPGLITAVGDMFFDVRCSPGALRITEVKPEGRKAMSVHDYLLGTDLEKGERLQ